MSTPMDPRERLVRQAHRHIRIPGGYVACTCGEDWGDHRLHVAEKVAEARAGKVVPPSCASEFVREFHEVYDCPVRETPRIDVPEAPMRLALIDEEVAELHDAIAAGDLIETADALADIAYVVYGAALTFGIDLDAVLAEVHRSNMSKLGADGRPVYREDGKILKGPDFFKPDIGAVLAEAAR